MRVVPGAGSLYAQSTEAYQAALIGRIQAALDTLHEREIPLTPGLSRSA